MEPNETSQLVEEIGTLLPFRQSRGRGLLEALQSAHGLKMRAAGAALLLGGSYEMAANAAGMSRQSLDTLRKSKPDVAKLLAECESAGMGAYETELMRRALAGASDRGSMRALEILLRTRRPEYREKTSASIEVVHRAETRGAELISGWDARDSKLDATE